MATNTVCHVEWDVTDIERARAFYEGLFDWKFESFGPDMVVFGTGTQHVGGLQKRAQVRASASPSVWIEVENVERYLERAQELGGSTIEPKHEVHHVGWSAQIADPEGNRIGLVQFDRK